MQDLLALNESVELFFGDFEFSVDFHSHEETISQLHELTVLIDILDTKDVLLYSIFMSLSLESARNLTSVLVENPEPEKEEINSTMMEMLNIFAGNALGDLPSLPDSENYYFLAPPILQSSYVVDPKDFMLDLNREVKLVHAASQKESSLYFYLFKKLHETK